MSEEAFTLMLSKQMPDAQKRSRADYVIESVELEETRAQVRTILASIRERLANA